MGIPPGCHQDAEHSEPTTPVGLGQDPADAELSELGHHLARDSRSAERTLKGEGDSWILEIRIFDFSFHGYQAKGDLAGGELLSKAFPGRQRTAELRTIASRRHRIDLQRPRATILPFLRQVGCRKPDVQPFIDWGHDFLQ